MQKVKKLRDWSTQCLMADHFWLFCFLSGWMVVLWIQSLSQVFYETELTQVYIMELFFLFWNLCSIRFKPYPAVTMCSCLAYIWSGAWFTVGLKLLILGIEITLEDSFLWYGASERLPTLNRHTSWKGWLHSLHALVLQFKTETIFAPNICTGYNHFVCKDVVAVREIITEIFKMKSPRSHIK